MKSMVPVPEWTTIGAIGVNSISLTAPAYAPGVENDPKNKVEKINPMRTLECLPKMPSE